MSGSIYQSRKGPRAGSGAHQALKRIHALGGTAGVTDLMTAAGWKPSMGVFDRQVIGPLLQFKLVVKREAELSITDDGLMFLGEPPSVVVATLHITPPRTAGPQRPLSARNKPVIRVMRPGAFDYRDIPSLHFGVQVPFKSNVKLEHEVSNG